MWRFPHPQAKDLKSTLFIIYLANGNNLISVRQSIPVDFPTQGRVIGSRTNPYITPHQVSSNLLPAEKTEFAPKILLTNVMSLVSKIDELRILTEQSFD